MILITGGTGMLGAHLILRLLQNGKKVRATKRPSSQIERTRHIFSFYTDKADQLFSQIEWIDCDILDYDEVCSAMEGCNQVYHSAGMIAFHPSDYPAMMEFNIDGTANMVNAALDKGIEQFCHVSSVAALGRAPKGEAADEETYWKPTTTKEGYSVSKYYSEMEVWRGIQEGLNAVIVNPSVIMGPGNWNASSSKLFQVVDNGMKFYTTGGTGFVDVDDVVRAMVMLMEPEHFEKVKANRYILAEGSYSYGDIFHMIADALEVKFPSIRATKWMLAIGWRLAAVKGFLTRTRPSITRDTSKGANVMRYINGEKITRDIPFQYTSIMETINRIGKMYRIDNG